MFPLSLCYCHTPVALTESDPFQQYAVLLHAAVNYCHVCLHRYNVYDG